MSISEGERLRRRLQYRLRLLQAAAVTWSDCPEVRMITEEGTETVLCVPTTMPVGDRPVTLVMTLPRREVASGEGALLSLSRGAEALVYVDHALLAGIDRHHQAWPIPAVAGQIIRVVYDVGPSRATVAEISDWHVRTEDRGTRALADDVAALLSLVDAIGADHDHGLHLLRAGNRAISEMDRAGSPAAVRAMVPQLEVDLWRRLEPFRAVRLGRVFAAAYSHLDASWFWTFDETRTKFRRTMANAVRYLEQFPEAIFHQTQAWCFSMLEQDDPELFARVRSLADQGRIEPVGGMWVESDVHLASGEVIARQLLHGQRYFFKTFGRISRVGWLPDSFGFQASLPQIFREGGLSAFVTPKLNLNETNRLPHNGFQWVGIDGSMLLTMHYQNPLHNYDGQVEAAEITETWNAFQDKAVHDEAFLTFGHGDGGGGPTLAMGERLRRFDRLGLMPWVRQGSVDAYLSAMDPSTLAQFRGELYFELTRGTYSAEARLKGIQRETERMLVVAEQLSALSALAGIGSYPLEELGGLWRDHLRLHFHDVLAGTVPAVVYQATMREWESVRGRAQGLAERAISEFQGPLLFSAAAYSQAAVVSVQKDHPWAIHGTAVADDADRVWLGPFVVPPHQIVMAGPSAVEFDPVLLTMLDDGGILAQNRFYHVHIGPDGEIQAMGHESRRIFDQPSRLALYMDRPMRSDAAMQAWDVDLESLAVELAVTAPVGGLEVLEASPLLARIAVSQRHGESWLRRVYRIDAVSPYLAVDFDIDWHEHERWLKWWLPLAINTDRATCDIAFGTCQRPTHASSPWDAARFEVYAHRFVDLSEGDFGVAVFNADRYGHALRGGSVGLTLLRSPTSPDDTADQGAHHFRLGIFPHQEAYPGGAVERWADAFEHPVVCLEGTGARRPDPEDWFEWQGEIGVVSAIKRAESDQCWIVRLVERENRRGSGTLSLPRRTRQVIRTSILEGLDPEAVEENLPIVDGRVRVEFAPYAIVTLAVYRDEAPVA